MWSTKTLADMENTCHEEADCNCNKQINGKWLEVVLHAGNGPKGEQYYYLCGNKRITREQAEKLFK
jgi:hypothetical protein